MSKAKLIFGEQIRYIYLTHLQSDVYFLALYMSGESLKLQEPNKPYYVY